MFFKAFIPKSVSFPVEIIVLEAGTEKRGFEILIKKLMNFGFSSAEIVLLHREHCGLLVKGGRITAAAL